MEFKSSNIALPRRSAITQFWQKELLDEHRLEVVKWVNDYPDLLKKVILSDKTKCKIMASKPKHKFGQIYRFLPTIFLNYNRVLYHESFSKGLIVYKEYNIYTICVVIISLTKITRVIKYWPANSPELVSCDFLCSSNWKEWRMGMGSASRIEKCSGTNILYLICTLRVTKWILTNKQIYFEKYILISYLVVLLNGRVPNSVTHFLDEVTPTFYKTS